MSQSPMLVQIVVGGDYRENYGAHAWDGKGECPQYWKCKGSFTQIVACNVPITALPSVMAELSARIGDFSERSEGHSYDAWGFDVQPNKLAHAEQGEWDFQCFNEIRSVSSETIQAFLTCFGNEAFVEPPADRFDTVVA